MGNRRRFNKTYTNYANKIKRKFKFLFIIDIIKDGVDENDK